jgi:hypothetical protein
MIDKLKQNNNKGKKARLLQTIAILRSQLESRLDCFCDENQRDEIVK